MIRRAPRAERHQRRRPTELSWLAAVLAAAIGATGLATGQALGPSGWTLAAAPAAVVILALRGRPAHRFVGWLALTAGCLVPHLDEQWPSRLVALAAAGAMFDAGLMLGVPTMLARGGSSFQVALGAALARAAAEAMWALTPFGDVFSWGLHLLDWTLLAQTAALFDLAGISVLLVFLVAAVTILVIDIERVASRRTAGLGLAVLALALGHGAGRLERSSGETLRVAAVGAAEDPHLLLEETAAAAAHRSEVVVYPISTLHMSRTVSDRTLHELAGTARAAGAWVVIGVRTPSGATESLLVRPDGRVDPLPYRQQLAPRRPELGGGKPPLPAQTGFGGLARLLGDDLVQSELARLAYERGATVLAISTDRADSLTEDQLLLARARAVANTCLVVLAARGGPSALLDPFGRVVAATAGAHRPGVALAAEVPLVRDIQPGIRLRRYFPYLCAALLVLLLALRPSAAALDAGPWEPRFRYDG